MGEIKLKVKVGPVTVDENKIVFKFLAPADMDLNKVVEIMRNKGKEIELRYGDNQITMEECGVTVPERGRIVGTIGPGGVVETAKMEEGGQVELEDVTEAQEPAEKATAYPSCPKCSFILEEGATECPNCQEPREFEEMNFDDTDEEEAVEHGDGVESDEEDADEHSEPERGSEAEDPDQTILEGIDKEAVEEYILENKPAFDGITYDFPALLEQKRRDGKTWLQISSAIGVKSRVLSIAWREYKTKVAQQMIG
ncbi:hypothetical protein [Gorillibacterium sp. sgz5001074]|uniref:hypothetical protein n=1 Tax=Gorillibacterium sp. sgz5001074 TaxID=3446695 RepID=UPI003F67926A